MGKALDVEALLRKYPPGKFEPRPFYVPCGDHIEVYTEDAESYAEWVSPYLTVMRAFDDHRVVGVKIRNVRRLVADVDNKETPILESLKRIRDAGGHDWDKILNPEEKIAELRGR